MCPLVFNFSMFECRPDVQGIETVPNPFRTLDHVPGAALHSAVHHERNYKITHRLRQEHYDALIAPRFGG